MAGLNKLTVHAGAHTRAMCPVSVELPWTYDETRNAVLVDKRTKKPIPCQVAKAKAGVTLTWLVDGLRSGEAQELVVRPGKHPVDTGVAQSGVVLKNRVPGEKLDVFVKGSLFTSYHYGRQWVRPFLHPVLGPGGVRVTRNWPIETSVPGETSDHPHHKSIWVAYGECDKVDNWSEEPGHGWQRHQRFVRMVSGPVYGEFTARIDWCTPKGRKQFEEIRQFRVYALPSGVRLLDVSVTFHMTQGPVTFRDTKEGGLLSVRVATSIDVPRGGRIENAYGGINEEETWGKSAPWCDYSGVVDGRHVGIAIMDHDANPRYPTGWHVRNYGLMTANCFAWSHYRPQSRQRGDMTFRKGSKTTWRYRLYIHRGTARTGRVADRFIDFVAPAKVTWG